MRRNQQRAGITGTAERSCGPVSRHPRAKLLTLNCANLRYLILPGDLVDADYLNLVAQIRNDARFVRLARLQGLVGLIRMPGDNTRNASSVTILGVRSGQPLRLTVRVPPFLGVTAMGEIIESDQLVEGTVTVPSALRIFDIAVVEVEPEPPSEPAPIPLAVVPRFDLLALPPCKGRDDVLVVGRVRIDAVGRASLDNDFIAPCSIVSGSDDSQRLVDDLRNEIQAIVAKVRATLYQATDSDPRSQLWRAQLLSHYRAINPHLESPTLTAVRLVDLVRTFVTDQIDDLLVMSRASPSERGELDSLRNRLDAAEHLGQSARVLRDGLALLRQEMSRRLEVPLPGTCELEVGRPETLGKGIWTEVRLPLIEALRVQLERLRSNSVRVAMNCHGLLAKNEIMPVHPSHDVNDIVRKPRLARLRGDTYAFHYSVDNDDLLAAHIRFFVRTDLSPDLNSIRVEAVR